MQRRFFTTTCARLHYGYGRPKKKLHWMDEIKLLNNVNRAMTHFDDFYASVYNKQWPSLRLGLLSPPKYMAIPNSLTGDLEGIAKRLEGLGAYNIQDMWMKQQAEMELERKEVDLKTDLGRLHQLDKKLEAIAATKRAEEMDVLYQNAPTTSKREEMRLGKGPSGRIVSDISEAAADFVPSSRLKGVEDFTFDSEYFSSYLKKHDAIPDDDLEGNEDLSGDFREVQFLQTSTPLEFPKLLVPMAFENGSPLMFPAAARESKSGYREYICVNGASILPVIALDLRPGTRLLDLCAGPGTKSVLSLMTLSLDSITCNDLELSRLHRIKRIMQEFTGSSQPSLVTYSRYNAREYPEGDYSRVLADVPCLNDRVSSTIKENNIFKPRRTKERLNLVKTQKGILMSGFKTLSKDDGSTIVYSTCTLSPIENDGVVMNALKETEVPDLHIDLKGLVKLVTPFERAGIFKIMRTRCGVIVLPNVVCNFGPMYISRIVVKSTTTNTNESESIEQQVLL